MIAKIGFWPILSIIFYIYFGYPLIIFLFSLIINNKVTKKEIEPYVTILITAYNEEKNIRKKIINTLSNEYPRDKMEIIVVSDSSTDETDNIVREFEKENVRLIRIEGRKGKTHAQNESIKYAKGEIVIFSDATTIYGKQTIKNLVRNFYDNRVGCVSGRLRYVKEANSDIGTGSASYWEYEVFIRISQSRIWTLAGATGCIYAIRKELYKELPAEIISDLVEPLEILAQGYRVVFEPEAVAFEEALESRNKEMGMRIRVITRAMRGFLYMKRLFNPSKHPYLFFQLLSHKILRWFFVEFAFLLLIVNLFLLSEPLYRIILSIQLVFYITAIMGYYINRMKKVKIKILSFPFYFCLIHLASTLSFIEFLKGKKRVAWETNR